MAKVSTFGLMAENMRVSGRTTICTARVCTLGKMAESMKGSTLMIENTALAFILGRIPANMKATGTMGSNMEREFTDKQMVLKGEEHGKKVNVLHGLMSYHSNETDTQRKVGKLELLGSKNHLT